MMEIVIVLPIWAIWEGKCVLFPADVPGWDLIRDQPVVWRLRSAMSEATSATRRGAFAREPGDRHQRESRCPSLRSHRGRQRRNPAVQQAELQQRLGGKVPFGPVYRMDEIEADPHFAAREMIVSLDVPGIGDKMRVAGVPIKFSETPGRVRHCGPAQGQQTDEVLMGIGLGAGELDQLRAQGVIR